MRHPSRASPRTAGSYRRSDVDEKDEDEEEDEDETELRSRRLRDIGNGGELGLGSPHEMHPLFSKNNRLTSAACVSKYEETRKIINDMSKSITNLATEAETLTAEATGYIGNWVDSFTSKLPYRRRVPLCVVVQGPPAAHTSNLKPVVGPTGAPARRCARRRDPMWALISCLLR